MYISFQYTLTIKLYIKKLLTLNISKLAIDSEETC